MYGFPEVPPVEEAPEALLSGGHLWILERMDGGPLRFRLLADGRVEFADADATFDAGSVPPHYRAAVRHVRETLDRGALRDAVADPPSVVFFGVSTHRRRVAYDFERTPAFLGTEVYDGGREAFLGPAAVERAYERLGLRPVAALAKELRATDFDPATYEFPASPWYDGPVAGVVLRDKTGNRARIDAGDDDRRAERAAFDPAESDPGELARALVTDSVVSTVRRRLATRDHAGSPDLVEAVLEAVFRRSHGRVVGGAPALDGRAFRSAVADRVSTVVTEE